MSAEQFSRRQILRLAVPALGGVFLVDELQAGPGTEPAPLFSFGLLGDPQYVDADPAGSRHYRASLGKLRSCVEQLNREALEVVVTVGDLIDRDFASFAPVNEIYAGLKTEHRCVLGNHDFSVADTEKEKVPAALGMTARYLSDTRKGWRMIRLDGTELAPYAHPKGTALHRFAQDQWKTVQASGKKNARSYNGGMGEKQMRWLRQELKDAAEKGQRVLLFNHFPVLPVGAVHNLWNDQELIDVLEAHPHVVAYFNGHQHQGGYHLRKGIHYLNVKGMVETAKETAFSIVKVYPDHLEVHGYGLEPKRELASQPGA
jgi:manganese-dependent ADP-ribose/CDP-alcohol diphosphatase